MKNPPTAGAEKDLRPEDHNDRTEATSGADTNYPNRMNDKNGMGSPYGGTQTPDPKSPDGNQLPPNPEADGKSATHPELGEEYEDPSSYGTEGGGGKAGDSTAGTDAAGSPIR